MNLVAEVIEGEDAVEEHQDAVGDVEVVFGAVADVFELADDVVGTIANGSGGEGRQTFDLRRPVLAKQCLDDFEDAGGAGFDFRDEALRVLGALAFEAGRDAATRVSTRESRMVTWSPRDSRRRNGRTPRKV